jgi:hypothetical protein
MATFSAKGLCHWWLHLRCSCLRYLNWFLLEKAYKRFCSAFLNNIITISCTWEIWLSYGFILGWVLLSLCRIRSILWLLYLRFYVTDSIEDTVLIVHYKVRVNPWRVSHESACILFQARSLVLRNKRSVSVIGKRVWIIALKIRCRRAILKNLLSHFN